MRIYTWCGKNIEEMTKEELTTAMREIIETAVDERCRERMEVVQ